MRGMTSHMGKTDRAEPTEKAPQGGDKSYNNRHQGFRQSEDTTGERGEKASGGLKGGDRHQGFKSGEASEATKVEGENRPGSGGIPEADVLSKAGEEPDKGDLTRAGREFQKHGSRRPEIWGQPIGNAEALNKSGQERLDTI